FGLVIGREQFEHTAGCRCQTRLARYGEFLGKAGMHHTNRLEAIGHYGFRINGGIDSGLSSNTKWLPSGTSMICRFSACRALSSMALLASTRSLPGTSTAPRRTWR